MKRIICATEPSDLYSDMLSSISDDVDYVLDGFEALARRGKDGESDAIELMNQFKAQIADMTAAIASRMSQEG